MQEKIRIIVVDDALEPVSTDFGVWSRQALCDFVEPTDAPEEHATEHADAPSIGRLVEWFQALAGAEWQWS